MTNDIVEYFDRNTVIGIMVTLIIVTFYSYTISIIYVSGLVGIIILKYKWN